MNKAKRQLPIKLCSFPSGELMQVKRCTFPSRDAKGKSSSTGAMDRAMRSTPEIMHIFRIHTANLASIPSKSMVRSPDGVTSSAPKMTMITMTTRIRPLVTVMNWFGFFLMERRVLAPTPLRMPANSSVYPRANLLDSLKTTREAPLKVHHPLINPSIIGIRHKSPI